MNTVRGLYPLWRGLSVSHTLWCKSSWAQNVIKLGHSLLPNLISRDSHVIRYLVQPRPSIRQAEMGECSRGFLIVGPRTRSRRGVWKASQPEILLSLVAMPTGALTFWWNWALVRRHNAGLHLTWHKVLMGVVRAHCPAPHSDFGQLPEQLLERRKRLPPVVAISLPQGRLSAVVVGEVDRDRLQLENRRNRIIVPPVPLVQKCRIDLIGQRRLD